MITQYFAFSRAFRVDYPRSGRFRGADLVAGYPAVCSIYGLTVLVFEQKSTYCRAPGPIWPVFKPFNA
jgi:hypothetical protein